MSFDAPSETQTFAARASRLAWSAAYADSRATSIGRADFTAGPGFQRRLLGRLPNYR